MNVTVKQIAENMKLSESRIRAYLCKKGAPTPVKEAVSIGTHGRKPGLYDLEEFQAFYTQCKTRDDRW